MNSVDCFENRKKKTRFGAVSLQRSSSTVNPFKLSFTHREAKLLCRESAPLSVPNLSTRVTKCVVHFVRSLLLQTYQTIVFIRCFADKMKKTTVCFCSIKLKLEWETNIGKQVIFILFLYASSNPLKTNCSKI